MTTKLSRNGYIIIKSNYTTKEIKEIKDELTAKPYTFDDFSNGKESNIPKGLYYAVGKIYSDEYDEENPFIRKSNTHIYTLEEMKKKIKEFGHWGCWDLVTETGL